MRHTHLSRNLLFITLTLGGLALAGPIPQADANTLYVTNAQDSGPGSLRDIITGSSSGDTVRFDPAHITASQTITLTTGPIGINHSLIVVGPPSDESYADSPSIVEITISGNQNSRIFYLLQDASTQGPSQISIYSLKFVNGIARHVSGAVTFPGVGGAIEESYGANLLLDDCTFSHCMAQGGTRLNKRRRQWWRY